MSAQKTVERDLKTAWAALKAEQPQLRIRDAANRLGVSEAELLCVDLGANVWRLNTDWEGFLSEVPKLGLVMALTRNEAVVIEKDGVFNAPQFFPTPSGSIGQVLGSEIDLRIFLSRWANGFAVLQETPRGTLRSFQFFDRFGEAIHKIYLRAESNLAAFESLKTAFLANNPTEAPVFDPVQPRKVEAHNTEADKEGFLAAWGDLKDTHDYFGLLRRFGVTRFQAMEVAEGKFTRRVPTSVLQKALRIAVESQIPIMAFVGNEGCIEIHTGAVQNLVALDNWFNVMDKGFNLHVNESLLKDAFVVEKPTTDGKVTSIEFYDEYQKIVLQLFGERKPGKPEREDWRQLAAAL